MKALLALLGLSLLACGSLAEEADFKKEIQEKISALEVCLVFCLDTLTING